MNLTGKREPNYYNNDDVVRLLHYLQDFGALKPELDRNYLVEGFYRGDASEYKAYLKGTYNPNLGYTK